MISFILELFVLAPRRRLVSAHQWGTRCPIELRLKGKPPGGTLLLTQSGPEKETIGPRSCLTYALLGE
jgi:hypothetical protein